MWPVGLDTTTFLRDYWQQQPLLLKSAVPNFTDPLSPEELAGLACEEDVEARLVFHRQLQWQLESGPFTEDDFLALPERDWSLLVQSVDLWQPELKSLFSLVDFLPAWRRDDLMISFATPGAGTGPHFDYYDVFILQGQGTRRWQLGQWCDSTTPLDTRSGMKILRHFEAQQTFELRAGDLLYIPAGLAHQGISHDNSLSYSIGFRAPSAAELLNELAHEAADQLPADLRYRDPPAAASSAINSTGGHIDSDIQAMLKRLIEDSLKDSTLLTRSFARHMTRPRYPELMPGPEHMAESSTVLALAANGDLIRNPASRFAWFNEGNDGSDGSGSTAQLSLVYDGEIYQLADSAPHRQALMALCSEDLDCAIQIQQWGETAEQDLLELMTALYNNGALISRQELDSDY